MENNNQNQNYYSTNYSNNSNGKYNYYQNLYNMFGGYNPILDNQSKSLKRLSLLGGCTFLGFVVMQYLFIIILNVTGLIDLYKSDSFFQIAINALAPLLYVGVPFVVLYLIYNNDEKESVMVFDKPKSMQLFILALFAGTMVCFSGDVITNYLINFSSALGVEFKSLDDTMPTGVVEYILYGISYAVIPALLEEFALRGVLLQPLRKYGDRFAIIATSVIFALMHGNMVQIPFAFIAGLALGYFAIATGSIWTSVAIHFINNLTSVIVSIYYDNHPKASYTPYYIIMIAVIVIGIVALITFKHSDGIKLKKDYSGMDNTLKSATYFCTPPVVLAIVYSMYTSLTLIRITKWPGVSIAIAILAVVSAFIIRWISFLKKDKRIKNSPMYTASLVIMIFAIVLGTLMIVSSALASSSGAQYYY